MPSSLTISSKVSQSAIFPFLGSRVFFPKLPGVLASVCGVLLTLEAVVWGFQEFAWASKLAALQRLVTL